jgi:hypothetical protein
MLTSRGWIVEAGTPNTLFRRGFTKSKASGRDVIFPDGRKLFPACGAADDDTR